MQQTSPVVGLRIDKRRGQIVRRSWRQESVKNAMNRFRLWGIVDLADIRLIKDVSFS